LLVDYRIARTGSNSPSVLAFTREMNLSSGLSPRSSFGPRPPCPIRGLIHQSAVYTDGTGSSVVRSLLSGTDEVIRKCRKNPRFSPGSPTDPSVLIPGVRPLHCSDRPVSSQRSRSFATTAEIVPVRCSSSRVQAPKASLICLTDGLHPFSTRLKLANSTTNSFTGTIWTASTAAHLDHPSSHC
jgi:hypothetical protein